MKNSVKDVRPRITLRVGLIQAILVAGSIITVVPILWMITASVKSPSEYARNPWWLPREFEWSNYVELFTERDFGTYVYNSFAVTVPALVIVLIASSMGAYGIVQKRFRMGRGVLGYFLLGQMIPTTAIIAPLYLVIRSLGLLNTRTGLVLALASAALPLSVFLMFGFFSGVPSELVDAASIDGAGSLRTFRTIYLPLGIGGIATVAIFQFLSMWNEILLVLLIAQKTRLQTLNVAVFQVVGEFGTDIPALFAGLTVAAAPVLLVYIVFTRQFIKGLTEGAIKG